MLAFINEMDRALNPVYWGLSATRHAGPGRQVHTVSVDITETDEAYRIEADLPGVAESDLTVTLKDSVLTIRGERPFEESKNTERRERKHLMLHRSFSLPHQIEETALKATLTNGVLTVTLPKIPEAEPRAIPITAA